MVNQWTANPWLTTWTEATSQMIEHAVATNAATLSAFGVDPDSETTESNADEVVKPAADLPGWETERTATTREALAVGDRFSFTKTITDDDVRSFAAASGDTNPLHLDNEFAEDTRFGERIAHGTLVGGLISAALARMPGLVVYLSQDLEFKAPVSVGERLTADCEIIEALGNNQYRLETRVHRDGETIIDGEAVVLVDELPE